MLKTTTWWRNLGGLVAACVLALLVVAPAIASAACVCDERPTRAVADQAVETASQTHDSAPCKAACCLGGHCHHASSMLDTPFEAIAALAPAPADHAIIPARALISRTPSPLDQPPRA